MPKPETQGIGRAVGKTKGDTKKARHIKIQVKETPGKRGAAKGHKRSLVRPVHQGGSFSGNFLTPKMNGASDKSRDSVFGRL